MINVSEKTAEALVALGKAVETANAHYKTCQSSLFRSFVVDTLHAKKIKDAIAELETEISKSAKESEKMITVESKSIHQDTRAYEKTDTSDKVISTVKLMKSTETV